MGKIFVFALIAVVIWVGATVYDEGSERAFGGLFARLSRTTALDAPANRSTPDRAQDAFQRAWNKSEGRVEQALEQSPEVWETGDSREGSSPYGTSTARSFTTRMR